jgi:hypothetical protein
MPFGLHKGKALHELPEPYFAWLESLPTLREPLKSAVLREHERRFRAPAAPPASLPPHLRELAVRVVSAGYRRLAGELHPDHAGGDGAAMQDLNRVVELLRGFVGANTR